MSNVEKLFPFALIVALVKPVAAFANWFVSFVNE
jgi:hypothetical protein